MRARGPGAIPTPTRSRPLRRAIEPPSWGKAGGPRPRRVFSMTQLEEWAKTADPEDPLRRALHVARLALEAQSPSVHDFSQRTMQKVFRERRTLSRTPESILSEFSEKLVKAFASELYVELPDEKPFGEILSRALSRTREEWGRATESFARLLRLPHGRPASIAIGPLEILHKEIQRSPLTGKRLKRRGLHAIAEWASRVTGTPAETLRRRLQEARREGRGKAQNG